MTFLNNFDIKELIYVSLLLGLKMNKIVGVLWKKEKNGNSYLSGVVNDLRGQINIAVFPNNKKQAENQPDYNIVISFGERKKKNSKNETPEEDDEIPF